MSRIYRFECTVPSFRRLAFALAICLCGGTLSASSLIYEPFAYTPGAELAGQNGGSGFTSFWDDADHGGEEVTAYDPEPIVVDSLSYQQNGVGMLTMGNRVRSYAAFDPNEFLYSSSFRRSFTPAVPSSGDVYWASFLLRRENDTRSNDEGDVPYFSLQFMGGTSSLRFGATDSSTGADFTLSGSVNSTVVNGMPANGSLKVPVPFGVTELLVVKMTFSSAGADDFKLFVNPTPGTIPLDSEAVLQLSLDLPTLTEVRYYSGQAEGAGLHEWAFDELHLATTYAEAVPAAPEPASAGLLLLGAGILAARRQRK